MNEPKPNVKLKPGTKCMCVGKKKRQVMYFSHMDNIGNAYFAKSKTDAKLNAVVRPNTIMYVMYKVLDPIDEAYESSITRTDYVMM